MCKGRDDPLKAEKTDFYKIVRTVADVTDIRTSGKGSRSTEAFAGEGA